MDLPRNAFKHAIAAGELQIGVWSSLASNIAAPGLHYANTEFRDGIANTFTAGTTLVNGHYPLYVVYEDAGTGVTNSMLTASYDGGATWTAPVRVNDNATAADEFQPNLTAAGDGTVSVALGSKSGRPSPRRSVSSRCHSVARAASSALAPGAAS